MKRALAVLLVLGSSARADVLHATREQPLVEVAHTVDITVDGGVATYKVRRVFVNSGKVADEAGLAIDLPAGAAATGLRIRAHTQWFDGELMEASQAAALYHELTGLGAYRAKDPALLQWLWADKLYLQVFPVEPHGRSTVEYTLTVPTRYDGGRYWLSYPRVATERTEGQDREGQTLALATPVVTVHGTAGPVSIDGHAVRAGTPVVLTPPVHQAWEDVVEAEPSASYVASAIVVPASSHTRGEIETATVTLDIAHTYDSDLRVELLTPEGKRVMLHDRGGGGDNNLRKAVKVELPAGTHGAGTWRLVVSDHAALDTGSIDAWSLAFGKEQYAARDVPVFIPDAPENAGDAGVAAIAIAPPAIDTWAARLGRVVASEAHAFGRLEIDVAPVLRPLPRKAQVVFAIDASWSIGAEGLAAELAIVRAYVKHVPDAEIELVAYRRTAQRVFGAFVAARDLERALAKHPIALGNGSAIDEGARAAAAILAPRSGTRRLVLVTDQLVRSSLSDDAALASLAALPADIVVHVVAPSLDGDDRATLVRDDTAPLAPLATKHHGIFALVGGLPTGIRKLEPLVLELVRPTRIENLAVTGLPVTETVLHEGSGLRVMVDQATAPQTVQVHGLIWSDPIDRTIAVTGQFSQQTAAFVFGADEHQSLSEAEMMNVAMLGHAVSPVTSYVAFEPGTRPSTIGFDRGGTGFGSLGAGRYGTVGLGVGSSRRPPDLAALVHHACAAGAPVALSVETTKDEIVDVTITRGAGARATCLADAVWATRLDHRFDLERETFTLAF